MVRALTAEVLVPVPLLYLIASIICIHKLRNRNDMHMTTDNRPTEKGLETRNFFGNFPFWCVLRSRDLEMALASCSEHLQEL